MLMLAINRKVCVRTAGGVLTWYSIITIRQHLKLKGPKLSGILLFNKDVSYLTFKPKYYTLLSQYTFPLTCLNDRI